MLFRNRSVITHLPRPFAGGTTPSRRPLPVIPRLASLPALGLLWSLAVTSCGGADDLHGVGPYSGWSGFDQAAGDTEASAPSLAEDLRVASTSEASDNAGASAPQGLSRTSSALSNDTGEPKVFYLAYADGKPLPKTAINACDGTAPAFSCAFADSLAECQRQIQVYLDRWYADFNLVFTLTRPTRGSFYTEVISSGGGAWCNLPPQVAGVAPFLCRDLSGGVSYTLSGGESAKQTAIIIAQEQAHLVGLQHTTSQRDLMNPTICTDCDGFEDVVNTVKGDNCSQPTQNSYRMMLERLGGWPGGPKPSAFGCTADAAEPTLSILEPSDQATVARDFSLRVTAQDDCEISEVSVNVMPMALVTSARVPPFAWDLSNISGEQTITVTATDVNGRAVVRTIHVTAPVDDGTGAAAPGLSSQLPTGCEVAGCNVGTPAVPGRSDAGVAIGPGAALALLIARRRRGR